MDNLDSNALRRAFGSYMTGVTVVTALTQGGEPIGFTANSFTSVSMDPPLLLVCPGNHLSSFDAFQTCTHFAVSILADGQEDISNIFASSKSARFENVAWTGDKNGVPFIDGAAAHFSCSVHKQIEAGDHCILIGRVTEFSATETLGLGYGQGGYFSLAKERLAQSIPTIEQSTVVGGVIESGESIYATRENEAFTLPTVTLSANVGAVTAIEQYLFGLGIPSHINCVYSVFDEPKSGTRFIFFRAKLDQSAAAHLHRYFLPIDEITQVRWQSNAIATMMTRYHTEHSNNQFGLYIGDSDAGEVHHENRT